MSFGGGGSKTQKVESKPWKPAQALMVGGNYKKETRPWMLGAGGLSPATGLLGRALTESMTDRPFFPGQTYAGFTPEQQEAMSGMAGYARGPMSQQVGQYQQSLQDMLAGPAGVADNPAVQAMMERNFREGQRMLNRAGRGAIAAGQLGGSRQGVAEAEAIGRLADANAATMLGAFGDLTRQSTAAAGMMPQAIGMGADPYRMLGEVGAQQQAMDQLGINEAMARHQYPEQDAMRRMDVLAKAAGMGAGFGRTSTKIPQQGSNPLASAVGLGLGALGMPWGGGTVGGALGGAIGGLFGSGGGGGYAYNTPGQQALSGVSNMWNMWS